MFDSITFHCSRVVILLIQPGFSGIIIKYKLPTVFGNWMVYHDCKLSATVTTCFILVWVYMAHKTYN